MLCSFLKFRSAGLVPPGGSGLQGAPTVRFAFCKERGRLAALSRLARLGEVHAGDRQLFLLQHVEEARVVPATLALGRRARGGVLASRH